jgi:hypothetical protein
MAKKVKVKSYMNQPIPLRKSFHVFRIKTGKAIKPIKSFATEEEALDFIGGNTDVYYVVKL